jgi:hypothetical protein
MGSRAARQRAQQREGIECRLRLSRARSTCSNWKCSWSTALTRFGGSGAAAVRWRPLASVSALPEDRARIALAALHYGRILAVHKDSRGELFGRVDALARALAEGGDADFEAWSFEKGGGWFSVWPWDVVSPDQLQPKTYVSTLKIDASGRLWVWLKWRGVWRMSSRPHLRC